VFLGHHTGPPAELQANTLVLLMLSTGRCDLFKTLQAITLNITLPFYVKRSAVAARLLQD
jgi:hypothetical protein